MSRLRFGLPTLVFLCCATFVSSLVAQGRTYEPHTPRFSPYLDYFRRDVGALDVYNSIVRPNRQIRSEFARQQSETAAQAARISQQEQQLKGREDLAPTGVGAGFMNFSHYYSVPRASARRR